MDLIRKKCQLYTIFIIVQLAVLDRANTNIDIDTSNTIVQFSPYVSILDRYNRSRYGANELVPLISFVATRFSKFYFELEYNTDNPENEQRSGLFNSVLAAAKFNCLSTTKQKIELTLMFFGRACECEDRKQLAIFAANVTDEVNEECMGTAHTILLKPELNTYCHKTTCPVRNYLPDKYKWGWFIDYGSYCEATVVSYELTDLPDVVVLEYATELIFLSSDLKKCKSYDQYQNHTYDIIHKVSVYDTEDDKKINVSRYVISWKSRFADKDNTYILSQAFDTTKTSYEWLTSGWWYLAYYPANTNIAQYIFEEKQAVANKIDSYEDPKNYEWLQQTIKFNKQTTGIIYTGNVPNELLLQDFCQLLVIDSNAFYGAKQVISNSINAVSSCGLDLRVIVQHDNSYTYDDLRNAEKQKIVTILIPAYRRRNSFINMSTTVNLLKSLGFQYGFILDIETCNYQNEIDTEPEKILLELLADVNSKMFVFSFQFTSDDYPSEYDATRMFRHRRALFQNCIDNIIQNGNHNATIGFAITSYHRNREFYESSLDMQTFVRFIQLMNNWAEQQRNIVIFVGKDMASTTDNDREVGWYLYDQDRFQYVTQREQALKLATFQYPKPKIIEKQTGLTNNETFLIIGVIVGLCSLLFITGVYFLKRYYREDKLSQEELEDFFQGREFIEESSQIEVYNSKYDKTKYEIPVGKFKIEATAVLGCGEFGKVSRGTIETRSGKVSVAIKTLNPQKREKSVLKGLLSEIKILAYVGKHDNIIELLGANTEKLKEGKVYIFLELCHLGSLQTFLRNIETVKESPVLKSVDEGLGIEMKFVNTRACHTEKILDPGLSSDLYRWSVEICKAMKYLAEKHIAHADLATRNVWLNLKRQAKICDFGLSRRMDNYTIYVKTQQEPLPWRWMAPESFREMQFNEKTDIWAYGVTLWEIYSLGCTPYPGLAWDENFVGMLEHGLKPYKPEFEEKYMYNIMTNCWKILPDERPSFCELLALLTSDGESYVGYLDLL